MFSVELEVFQGPFDLLLQLIAKRELDITEVALAQVTDEFLDHMRRFPDLSSMSEFLVVAATLLDMKAAQLLPRSDATEEVGVEEFAAKDLLFARLILYRAFKDASIALAGQMEAESTYFERRVPLEEEFTKLAPYIDLVINPKELAEMAALLLAEPVAPDEAEHVAKPKASLEDELAFVNSYLRDKQEASFSALISGVNNRAVIVTRFLAVLELYRQGITDFVQRKPLDTLVIILKKLGTSG